MRSAKLAVVLLVAMTATGAYANQFGEVEVGGFGDASSCPKREEMTDEEAAVREQVVPVEFDFPYSAPPVVMVSLGGFAIDDDLIIRIDTFVEDLTAEGFNLRVTTWCNTLVNFARARWIAIPGIPYAAPSLESASPPESAPSPGSAPPASAPSPGSAPPASAPSPGSAPPASAPSPGSDPPASAPPPASVSPMGAPPPADN